MAKLIVSQNGEVIDNRFLDESSFTIGSLADSDLRPPSRSQPVACAYTSVGNVPS
jgi:hypothetical protein